MKKALAAMVVAVLLAISASSALAGGGGWAVRVKGGGRALVTWGTYRSTTQGHVDLPWGHSVRVGSGFEMVTVTGQRERADPARSCARCYTAGSSWCVTSRVDPTRSAVPIRGRARRRTGRPVAFLPKVLPLRQGGQVEDVAPGLSVLPQQRAAGRVLGLGDQGGRPVLRYRALGALPPRHHAHVLV